MDIDKYNHYARWYDRERRAAGAALMLNDLDKVKEFTETLEFIKEQMNKIKAA